MKQFRLTRHINTVKLYGNCKVEIRHSLLFIMAKINHDLATVNEMKSRIKPNIIITTILEVEVRCLLQSETFVHFPPNECATHKRENGSSSFASA